MNKDIQNYLWSVPDERRGFVDQLHSLIVEVYPKVEVDMRYKIPSYCRGDGWVAVANQ